MLHLTNVIDRATGYVYVQPSNTTPPGTVRPEGDADSRAQRPKLLSNVGQGYNKRKLLTL